MAALNLTELEAELTRNESVDSSAAAAITALLNEIAAGAGNQAAIDATVARWRASTDKLAAAVAATPGQ